MTTADDAPSAERVSRLIPVRLVWTLCAYVAVAGIYATAVAIKMAYGDPVPELLHNTMQFVLAVSAVVWLAALIIAAVLAVGRRVLVIERRFDALLSNPAVSAALHPAGTAPAELGDNVAEEVYAAGYVDGRRDEKNRPGLRLVASPEGHDVRR